MIGFVLHQFKQLFYSVIMEESPYQGSIEEAHALKKQLEDKMVEQIAFFESQTGLKVESIEYDRRQLYGLPDHTQLTVKAMLP